MKPVVLTIAGSDPSGGAGLQADLKTFHQFGVYGAAAVTLITVQNTVSVARVECLPAELVREQIRAVLEDMTPAAGKTGALGNRAIVEAVAEAAAGFDFPLVVDPVLSSTHGVGLLEQQARQILLERLLPRAALVTPNLQEASVLVGFAVEDLAGMRRAAEALLKLGCRAVLIKGGHLPSSATDVLWAEGRFYEFSAPRIATHHTHGSGCTYSAAIAAGLARGLPLVEAVQIAKAFVTEAIRTHPGLGRGAGPLNHHARTGLPE